jgi:hypothetical protein
VAPEVAFKDERRHVGRTCQYQSALQFVAEAMQVPQRSICQRARIADAELGQMAAGTRNLSDGLVSYIPPGGNLQYSELWALLSYCDGVLRCQTPPHQMFILTAEDHSLV